jgi:hypothetical protein
MYYVTFTNGGRREKTPMWDTYELAKESAEFLKFQGAKRVKIVGYDTGLFCGVIPSTKGGL